MSYESAVIRDARNNVLRIAHPSVPGSPITYLSASVAAAAVTLAVADNYGFANADLFVVGRLGSDATEIKKVNAAVTQGTALTVTALTYAHAVDSQVALTLWDQVEISGAATATGSKTVITTTSIQPDRPETTYAVVGTTYAFYFARYKNSVTSAFSSYSDPADATGYAKTTVRSVKDSALSMVNEQVSGLISDDFLNQEIFNCEEEVYRMKQKWSWADSFGTIIGETVEGGYRIALPADIADPYSNNSIKNLRVGTRNNLTYLEKQEWDKRYIDVAHATVATTFLTGAVSIVLDDSSDFDSVGSITIGASSYAYTANDKSTGTLTVPATSDGQTAGADVWQNAVYAEPAGYTVFEGYLYFDCPVTSQFATLNVRMDYYRKPTAINSDDDSLNLPDFTVYHYYLAYKILLRKSNGSSDSASQEMKSEFQRKALQLMRKDRLPRVSWRPRLNSMRFQDSFQVIATNPLP